MWLWVPWSTGNPQAEPDPESEPKPKVTKPALLPKGQPRRRIKKNREGIEEIKKKKN